MDGTFDSRAFLSELSTVRPGALLANGTFQRESTVSREPSEDVYTLAENAGEIKRHVNKDPRSLMELYWDPSLIKYVKQRRSTDL